MHGFFCLLILALFSIGGPDQVLQEQPPLSDTEQLKLAARSGKTAENQKQQYAFYFNGQFYNKQLKHLHIDNFSSFETQQPLILAVQDNLPLKHIMALRKQINHPNLSITMLNQSWQTQLEKIQ
ncbi:hypothetical protein C427_4293 [Paraglaciecola psychrophila 170]|uniref:Uncharacterized protein n=1 Tax=Paraglaciecola psychrophila 170 TaxID=1129794 RepID=M4RRV6_9ALTE|nr:hypothetical protein [Paraglaciecola psychrophila]AGH46395.1 hypothetical protein C427_4293 [Paraglaciecola psychrophila 170]